jgi:hypothetical protein
MKETIKPWWLLVAFLAGLAVALGSGELILSLRENRLELSAPRVNFLSGQPLARLKNATAVPFAIQVTLYSARQNSVINRTSGRCVFSFDIWQHEREFRVVTLDPPRQASRLSDRDAEKWCLTPLMTFDVSRVTRSEPLWARVDIRAEESPRTGGIFGASVSESGVSLTNGLASLVELFSRPPQSAQPHWDLKTEKFTLADLIRTGRGS